MRDPVGFLLSLPNWCQEYVSPALAGDVDAVASLMVAAPNADRGMVCKALWKHGVPADALRAAVESGWDHDHVQMFEAFGRSLPKVFRAAQFDVSHLPKEMDVWRGGRGSYVNLGLGCSWTLDRDIACWFAVSYRAHGGTPADALVLHRR